MVIPLTSLAVLALVPALLLGGAWQYAAANVPPTTTTTTTTLPPPPVDELESDLLTFRRHPVPLAVAAADRAATEAFDSQIASLGDAITGETCLRIVDDDEIVADLGSTGPLVPASNQKLFVAAVALHVLGPEHRFRTELVSVRPADGVIAGDVYLVGGGDPVLRTDDIPDPLRHPAFNVTRLEPLADQLVTLGVTSIRGDVVGDGSRYDDEFRAPTWDGSLPNGEAGPYDALLVNDGLITAGEYGLDPSRSAARVFTDLLLERGIAVDGAAANATRPSEGDFTTLAFVESEPLPEILVELLHTSDNNTAELLVKELGVAVTGEGTREAGLGVIWRTLEAWGVPMAGVELHDGSGLSRSNRATCAALAATVSATPVSDDLVDLLPVAGRDGTLASQLLRTPAEARLQAKTGTLADVKALTGRQPGADRRPVEFSLVQNGEDVDDPARYEPLWTQVIALIDQYPIEIAPDVTPYLPLS